MRTLKTLPRCNSGIAAKHVLERGSTRQHRSTILHLHTKRVPTIQFNKSALLSNRLASFKRLITLVEEIKFPPEIDFLVNHLVAGCLPKIIEDKIFRILKATSRIIKRGSQFRLIRHLIYETLINNNSPIESKIIVRWASNRFHNSRTLRTRDNSIIHSRNLKLASAKILEE